MISLAGANCLVASNLFTENNVNSRLLFSFSYFVLFYAFYFLDSCFDVWQLQPRTKGRSAFRYRRLPLVFANERCHNISKPASEYCNASILITTPTKLTTRK